MKFKDLLIYGLVALSVIIVIKGAEYSLSMKAGNPGLYLAIGAALFIILGIFIARQLYFDKRSAGTTEIKRATAEELGLSKRESDVLELVIAGMSNQEIADKLFISVPTVKTHLSNIYSKLDVSRRTQAVQKAIELGIFQTHT